LANLHAWLRQANARCHFWPDREIATLCDNVELILTLRSCHEARGVRFAARDAPRSKKPRGTDSAKHRPRHPSVHQFERMVLHCDHGNTQLRTPGLLLVSQNSRLVCTTPTLSLQLKDHGASERGHQPHTVRRHVCIVLPHYHRPVSRAHP
jgi:hypothetical protein